ncbi:MAG: sugar kinase [Anaerolineae bacterium]|nr:sugar kinase [Anaerolineae bacterium]
MTDDQPQFDLITLGETMLRLMPPHGLRLGQSTTLDMQFGGAEANVAANLARLGRRVSWWSRLPDNPLGRQLAASLRGQGVDTSHILWADNERLGLYFVEQGEPPRGVQVWYDRAHSAASRMQPEHVAAAWLESARWLHLTGITPALSDSCRATVEDVMRRARAQRLRISFDVNYRALLWSAEAAAAVLSPLCAAADIAFVALRDAHNLFDARGDRAEVARQLQDRWGGIVVVTDGDQGAAAYDGSAAHDVEALPAVVTDRMGAGDAFASGVIDRLLDDAPLAEALRFGAALAALKLTIPGDVACVTREEVRRVLDRSASSLRR